MQKLRLFKGRFNMLGKIINGQIIYADYRKPLKINETTQVIQPKDEHFIAAGYIEIVEDELIIKN
jgi:hypothetical protein